MIDLFINILESNFYITLGLLVFTFFMVISWLDVRLNTKAMDKTMIKYFDRLEADNKSLRTVAHNIKTTVEATDHYIRTPKRRTPKKAKARPYWELDDEETPDNVTPIRARRA